MGVAVVVLAAGCAADRSGVGHSTPQSSATRAPAASSPAPATPKKSRRAQALAAYRGMWSDFVAAGRTSNADDPALRRHTSGRALELIRSGLRSDRKDGVVSRGHLRLDPQVVKVKPKKHPVKIWIRDCADASRWLTYTRSGKRTKGGSAGRHHVEALARLKKDTWKVTAFFVEKVGTC